MLHRPTFRRQRSTTGKHHIAWFFGSATAVLSMLKPKMRVLSVASDKYCTSRANMKVFCACQYFTNSMLTCRVFWFGRCMLCEFH